LAEDCYYGEVPEHHVPPDLLTLGKETFEFCLRHYGNSDPPLKLRWVRKDKADYHYAKILDNIKKLGGEKMDRLERGYIEESEPILGLVRHRLFSEERPKSVFVAAETPVSMIIQVVGHEFYHARYSPGYASEADEKAADKFGERVEQEMSEAEKKKAMENWKRQYREIELRKKS